MTGSRAPRKPSLSPTKITTFLACPDKFYWTYVSDQGRYYLRSKSYFSFGTTLHGVLQRFHDARDQGVQTVDQAVAALEDSWIEAGYNTPGEMAEAMGEGKVILENYIQRFETSERDATTIMIERQLRRDMGDFTLIGRLDRVDEHADGTIEVIDYKSGRQSVEPSDIEFDIAMNCYMLLLQQGYPERPIRATIIALRSGDSASVDLDPVRMEEFRADLSELGRIILNQEWEGRVPEYKDLCPSCDFFPLCQRAGLVVPGQAPAEFDFGG